MIISLIAAASENNVIGARGNLPWKLPDDWKHFKELTSGHPIIMGRKTFASIGRPLPNRRNIVITHREGWSADGCDVVHSLDEAFRQALSFELSALSASELFIIGGGEIYRQALPRADRIYLTRVHAMVEGDVTFPALPPSEWREVNREEHPADERHQHPFTFLVYERIK